MLRLSAVSLSLQYDPEHLREAKVYISYNLVHR